MAHPHVRKVLCDEQYWDALDDISGPQLAVFSVELRQGRVGLPEFPPRTFGYMAEVWKEPSENRSTLDDFGLDSSENMPTFIVFAVDEEGHILRRSLPILEESTDSVYASLKESMSLVAEAISGIKDENLQNTYGVQAAVNLKLDHAQNWQRVKKTLAFWMWLKGLAG